LVFGLLPEEGELWRQPSLQQVDVADEETNDDDTARQTTTAWLLLVDGLFA
jgi:hypothetical protein